MDYESKSVADAAEAYVVLDSGGEQVGDTTYSEDEARYVAEWYGTYVPDHAPYRVLYAVSPSTECRSAFVADVSRQLRNALAVGSWDMVEQLLAEIEPTDCGSVAGKEEGNGE